ncbi:hypothetical protein GCM10007857_64600 [Bradyrhizobium iriomotense]|uniref:Transposase n=1 Tax=Bradyrhizobium iriomotense TaxID=441950 RepID=A0ABQ6B8C3_9BRAD|nr:hypothetical protein GCM10007857_64600 [Bradyrhizobium iriomotense]
MRNYDLISGSLLALTAKAIALRQPARICIHEGFAIKPSHRSVSFKLDASPDLLE